MNQQGKSDLQDKKKNIIKQDRMSNFLFFVANFIFYWSGLRFFFNGNDLLCIITTFSIFITFS